MADYTAEVQLQDHKRNDIWQGIPEVGPILFDDAQPPNPLTRVRMHFTTRSGASFTIDSDTTNNPDAEFIIDDAAAWTCHVPPLSKFLQLVEPWSWDMEFYSASYAAPITIFKGTITVNPDTTR